MNSLLGSIEIPSDAFTEDEKAQIMSNQILERCKGLGLEMSYDDAKAVASHLIATQKTIFECLVDKQIKKQKSPDQAIKLAREELAIHQFVSSMNLLNEI